MIATGEEFKLLHVNALDDIRSGVAGAGGRALVDTDGASAVLDPPQKLAIAGSG